MATKLDVWKQAAVHLGKEATTLTLSSEEEMRYQFDLAWPGVVAEAFIEGDWNNYKKTVALVINPSATPALGYTYVFDYPDDYERSLVIAPISDFSQAFFDYVDQDGYLHANTNVLYLKYISNARQADDQVNTWPTHIWRYVAMKLAFETCDKLTGSSSKTQELEQRRAKALRQAKSVDARNEPNKAPAPGSWLRARRGGYGRNNGLGNTILGGEVVFEEGDV